MPFFGPDTDEVAAHKPFVGPDTDAVHAPGFVGPEEDHANAVDALAKDTTFDPIGHALYQAPDSPEVDLAAKVAQAREQSGSKIGQATTGEKLKMAGTGLLNMFTGAAGDVAALTGANVTAPLLGSIAGHVQNTALGTGLQNAGYGELASPDFWKQQADKYRTMGALQAQGAGEGGAQFLKGIFGDPKNEGPYERAILDLHNKTVPAMNFATPEAKQAFIDDETRKIQANAYKQGFLDKVEGSRRALEIAQGKVQDTGPVATAYSGMVDTLANAMLLHGDNPELGLQDNGKESMAADFPQADLSPAEKYLVEAGGEAANPTMLAYGAIPNIAPALGSVAKAGGGILEAAGNKAAALKAIFKSASPATKILLGTGGVIEGARLARDAYNHPEATTGALALGLLIAGMPKAGRFAQLTGTLMEGGLPAEGTGALRIGAARAAGQVGAGAALGAGLEAAQGGNDLEQGAYSGAVFGLMGAFGGVRATQEAATLEAAAQRGRDLRTGNPYEKVHDTILASLPKPYADEIAARRATAYDGSGTDTILLDQDSFSDVVRDRGGAQAEGARGLFEPHDPFAMSADGKTIYLNADAIGGSAAKKGGSTADTFGHEYGHAIVDFLNRAGRTEDAKKLFDAVGAGLTGPQFDAFRAQYRDALIKSGATPEQAERQTPDKALTEEQIAEITRDILSGKSIASFAYPKPIKERIVEAAKQAFGITSPTASESADLNFGARRIKEVADQVNGLLREQGQKAFDARQRARDLAADKAEPTITERLGQIETRVAGLEGQIRDASANPDSVKANDLQAWQKERAELLGEAAKLSDAESTKAAKNKATPLWYVDPTPQAQPAPRGSGERPLVTLKLPDVSGVSLPPEGAGIAKPQTPRTINVDIKPAEEAATEAAPAKLTPEQKKTATFIRRNFKGLDAADAEVIAAQAKNDADAVRLVGERLKTKTTPAIAPAAPLAGVSAELGQTTAPAAQTAKTTLAGVTAEAPAPENKSYALGKISPEPENAQPDTLANTNPESNAGVPDATQVGAGVPETGRAAPVIPTAAQVQDALGAADQATVGAKPEKKAKARQDALRAQLPQWDARSAPPGEAQPDELHVHTDEYGKTSVRGTIDESNPLHAAFLAEKKVSPETRQVIQDMQARRSKVAYIDYYAAKVESGKEHSATQRAEELAANTAEERAAGAEGTDQLNKAVIPFQTKITNDGNVNIIAYSPDKLHANALAVVRAANEAGFAHGYEGTEAEINATLSRDLQTAADNHANGFSMNGQTDLTGQGRKGEPFRDAAGKFIDNETAKQRQDVLNMAANDTGMTASDAQAAKQARYEQAMRDWEAGGKEGRKPRKPAELSDRAKVEEQNALGLNAAFEGYRNPETGEPNKLRDALSTAGFDPATQLESPIETLRPELIRDVRDEPNGDRSIVRAQGDPVTRAPKGDYVRGGFMPNTPEFKKWFGESKVVDKEGKPLPVYHGSGVGIPEFKYEFTDKGNDQIGSGFYFTTNPNTASGYAHRTNELGEQKLGGEHEPSVVKTYLSLQNPLDAESKKPLTRSQVKNIIEASPDLDEALSNWGDVEFEGKSKVLKSAIDAYVNIDSPLKQLSQISSDFYSGKIQEFNAIAHKATGYDGVKQEYKDETHYAAWFPTQIKSATGNSGQYDPNNPDIRFMPRAERDSEIYRQPSIDISDDIPKGINIRQDGGLWVARNDEGKILAATASRFGTLEQAVANKAAGKFMPNILPKAEDTKTDPLGFFSGLRKVVSDKIPNRASAQQILATLDPAKSGVKKEEMEWVGVPQFLQGKENVSKKELLDFIDANSVKLGEVIKGTMATKADGDRLIELTEKGNLTPEEKREYNRLSELSNDEDTTKFSQYTLPGGTNYKETLLTLPVKASNSPKLNEVMNDLYPGREYADLKPLEKRQVDGYVKDESGELPAPEFKSSHWDEPNVLAHIRQADHVDTGRNKVRLIEELQSDWHQRGRKEGYSTPLDDASLNKATELEKQAEQLKQRAASLDIPHVDKKAIAKAVGMDKNFVSANAQMIQSKYADVPEVKEWVARNARKAEYENLLDQSRQLINQAYKIRNPGLAPDAPFKKSWMELAFKRALADAVNSDMDKIAWVPGEIQADRYDLSKQVSRIDHIKNEDGTYSMIAVTHDGQQIIKDHQTEQQLADTVGKEVAQKIANREGEPSPASKMKMLSGVDLKVGGEGMKAFYDKILPDFVRKYVGKMGGKIETTNLGSGTAKIIPTNSGKFLLQYTDSDNGRFDAEVFDTREEAEAEAKKRGKISFTVQSVTITHEMRKAVQAGQAMFMPDTGKPGESGDPREDLAREAEAAGVVLSKDMLKGLMSQDPDTMARIRARIKTETGSDAKFMPRDETDSEKKDREATARAERYFEIGQSDDEAMAQNDNWIYDAGNRSIKSKQGGTHGSNFSHDVADRTFKGWYDRENDTISVVFPEYERNKLDHEPTVDDIPTSVEIALRRKFGKTASLVPFMPRAKSKAAISYPLRKISVQAPNLPDDRKRLRGVDVTPPKRVDNPSRSLTLAGVKT